MNRLILGLVLSVVFHAAIFAWERPDTEALPKVNVNPGKTSIAVQMQEQTKNESVEQPEPKEVKKPDQPEEATPKEVNRPTPKKPSPQKPKEESTKDPPKKEPEKPEPKKQETQKPSVAQKGAEWVKKADYRRNPSPEYPEVSRRRGEEGTVILRVRVNKKGRPLTVNVQESSGYSRLDRAAKKTVRNWEFTPAKHAGVTVESTVLVPVQFRINKG